MGEAGQWTSLCTVQETHPSHADSQVVCAGGNGAKNVQSPSIFPSLPFLSLLAYMRVMHARPVTASAARVEGGLLAWA